MALARLSVKVGKAGKASPHAAYIAREGRYADRLEKGERLEATEAGNMPAWAQSNPQAFWQAADAHERANGTTYREMEIALPRELDASQRRELVAGFVQQELGDRHAYQWAIHVPTAADGGEQPHVHLMFSERTRDGIERDPEQYFKRYNAKAPERGGCKKANTGKDAATRKVELKELRGRWEVACNQALERAGQDARIDMRSYAEQGRAEAPERKQLPSQWRGQGKAQVIEFRAAKAEQARAVSELRETVPDVRGQVVELERARYARMTSKELAAEIARIRPRPADEVAREAVEVVEAKRDADTLARLLEENKRNALALNKREAEHNSKGFFSKLASFGEPGRIERERQALRERHGALAPKYEEAQHQYRQTFQAATSRVQVEQMPMVAKVAELDQLRQEKARQELKQQMQQKAEKQAATAMAERVMEAADLHRRGKLKDVPPRLARALDAVQSSANTQLERKMKLQQAFTDPKQRASAAELLKPYAKQIENGLDRGLSL